MSKPKRAPFALKSDTELRELIKRLASRPNGMTRRALHDATQGCNRKQAMELMRAMAQSDQLCPATRADISGESRLVQHWFASARAAKAWLTAPRVDVQEWLRQPTLNNRAETKRSDAVNVRRRSAQALAVSVGRAQPEPALVPLQGDPRYTVQGPVPRVVSAAECRPWAAAAAAGGLDA